MTNSCQPAVVSWQHRARSLTNAIINLVFPPVCVNCGDVGALLCASCTAEIAWMSAPICAKCGRIVPEATAVCPTCVQRPLPLTAIRAAVLFADPIPPIIHDLKYNGLFGMGDLLGSLMAQAWPTWQQPADMVVPVPLHSQRLRERGYNQSDLLAKAFAQRVGLPVNTAVLHRIRHTRPQVGLDAANRLQNVQTAFAATEDVRDKHILLIDDVCTTGATLAAAADALLQAGASTVAAYCLSRAT